MRARDTGYSNVHLEVANVEDAGQGALLCSASLPYLWDVKVALLQVQKLAEARGLASFQYTSGMRDAGEAFDDLHLSEEYHQLRECRNPSLVHP